MGGWRRYWSGAGGRYTAAATRIAVGVSALWMLVAMRDVASVFRLGSYRPIGILKLIPAEPPAAVIDLLWWIATLATIAMIAGLRTRLATGLSCAATLVICAFHYSFTSHWSHDLNPTQLAQLALLGAHTGDAWSIDAWLARRRTRALPEGRAYLWGPRLVALALGIVMASAAFSKLLAGGMSLDWALSDNLRHQIMVRFDLAGLPRPPLADWVIAEPWRWKSVAMLNLVAQTAPLVGVLLVRRPILRALCGLVFATEVAGLSLVMGFWNPWWFPLAAAFIDWDRLVGDPPGEPAPVPRTARLYIAAFVACDVLIAFWHWPLIDQKVGAYPFTSFPMFASVRATPPYDEHRPYEVLDTVLEIDSEASEVMAWAAESRAAWSLLQPRSADTVKALLVALRGDAVREFPKHAIGAARIVVRANRAAPYPAAARFDRVTVATVGELSPDGTFTQRLGALAPRGARYAITGLPGDAALAIYRDGTYLPLAATREGEAFVIDRPNGYVVARHRDRWFLVGSLR